ncbi:MAG: hypothetical protein ACK5PS_06955 [Desulfopila sp.]
MVVSPETTDTLRNRVRNVLLSMNETQPGRDTLRKLDLDLQGGFITTSDDDYARIRLMINEVPITSGRGCHPNRTY